MTIYYVGADIAPESIARLYRLFGEEGTPKHPHVTIIYSRTWFPYKLGRFYPLVIEPPYIFDILGGHAAMRFNSQRLFERHIEMRNDGASWDHDKFQSHITIGGRGLHYTPPDFPIILSNEYYQTWSE